MFFSLVTQHPLLKNRGSIHLRVTLYFCVPHWHSRGKGRVSSQTLHTLQSFCRKLLVKVIKNVNLVKLKLKNINKPNLTQLLRRSFTLVSPFDHYHISYSQAGLLGVFRWRKCCWAQSKHQKTYLSCPERKKEGKSKLTEPIPP